MVVFIDLKVYFIQNSTICSSALPNQIWDVRTDAICNHWHVASANEIWKWQWEGTFFNEFMFLTKLKLCCVHHFNDIFIFGIIIIDFFLLLCSIYRKVQREHSSKFLHVKKVHSGHIAKYPWEKEVMCRFSIMWGWVNTVSEQNKKNLVNYFFNVIVTYYAKLSLGIFMPSKLCFLFLIMKYNRQMYEFVSFLASHRG